jgi:hypothetical protein
MSNKDPEGYDTKVTFLGKGWGVQILRNDCVIDETFVKSKDSIGTAIASMLRMIDKCGNPSSMASASRDRQCHKIAKGNV